MALKVQDVDVLIWSTSTSDSLTLKDGYHFKSYPTLNLQWAKEVWCTDIPSSKSILVWKLINKRLHTDDLLKARECIITSVYHLYRSNEESIQHLFFLLCFCQKLVELIWENSQPPYSVFWFGDLLHFCIQGRSQLCSLVLKAIIVYLLYNIWMTRNMAIFKLVTPSLSNMLANIMAQISTTSYHSKLTSNSSMQDLLLLKALRVSSCPPRAPVIKEVIWHPLNFGWLKCNCDDASNYDSLRSDSEGISQGP